MNTPETKALETKIAELTRRREITWAATVANPDNSEIWESHKAASLAEFYAKEELRKMQGW